MKTIRASEIGTFLFCERAWWLQRKGVEPINTADLISGTDIHHHHSREVFAAGCMQTLAVVLLLAALAAGVAYLVNLTL